MCLPGFLKTYLFLRLVADHVGPLLFVVPIPWHHRVLREELPVRARFFGGSHQRINMGSKSRSIRERRQEGSVQCGSSVRTGSARFARFSALTRITVHWGTLTSWTVTERGKHGLQSGEEERASEAAGDRSTGREGRRHRADQLSDGSKPAHKAEASGCSPRPQSWGCLRGS